MTYNLSLESIDDEKEVLSFPTSEKAIAHAVHWFVDGYDNHTIGRETRIEVAEEAVELARALREGREFHCSRFHETVSLTPANEQKARESKP